MRMPEEIEIEITELESLLKRLNVQRGMMGDNLGQIEAEIETLRNNLSEDKAWQHFGQGEEEVDVRDAATRAAQWLFGSESDAPSISWKESPHLFKNPSA